MSTELAGAGSVVAQLRDAAREAARVALMTKRLRDLAGLLLARGLKVVTRSPVMTVSDPSSVETNSPAGDRNLTQSVLLRATDEGLLWYLVQPRPLGRTPELEPLCPGADIDQAAARIAQALAEKLASSAES